MANPLNGTGKNGSVSGSTPSRKPRQATSFVPRPLTPSEIEWLRQEGREFQEQYSQIKAAVLAGNEGCQLVDVKTTPETTAKKAQP